MHEIIKMFFVNKSFLNIFRRLQTGRNAIKLFSAPDISIALAAGKSTIIDCLTYVEIRENGLNLTNAKKPVGLNFC